MIELSVIYYFSQERIACLLHEFQILICIVNFLSHEPALSSITVNVSGLTN